jgi:hypothetical protein
MVFNLEHVSYGGSKGFLIRLRKQRPNICQNLGIVKRLVMIIS